MNLAVCPNLAHASLTGTWFRAIQPQHWQTCLQTTHTAMIPGRFNAGNQAVPGFEILYLAENSMVALYEVQSLFGSPTSPGSVVVNPRQSWIIINVDVKLQRVLDLTDVAKVQNALGTNAQELTGDWRGYAQRSAQTSVTAPIGPAPTQALGHALYAVFHGSVDVASLDGQPHREAVVVVVAATRVQ